MSKRISTKTVANYENALGGFIESLRGRKASDATLAEYLTARHKAGIAPGSINILVQAVKLWEKEHASAGAMVGKLTRDTLAGIRRAGKGRGRGQVKGLNREQVAIMATKASASNTTAGTRDAALLWVMSDALLRIGEAVAIDCEHITIEADGSGRLVIPHSKTDQEGAGAVQFLHPRTISAVEALKVRAGYTAGPLFRAVRKGDHCSNARLSGNRAREVIQYWAKHSKLEGVSGHSLRIGTAQELVQRGATRP